MPRLFGFIFGFPFYRKPAGSKTASNKPTFLEYELVTICEYSKHNTVSPEYGSSLCSQHEVHVAFSQHIIVDDSSDGWGAWPYFKKNAVIRFISNPLLSQEE
jgi:hypothetical protein